MSNQMQRNIEVSVIIVNYNTKTILHECLDSIYMHSKDVSFEVIVIDNGSVDGSVEFFKSDERILFIQNEQNDGFGRANNLGLKYAKGDFIFFLNSDTIFRNNALLIFYEQMKNMPLDVACLGALLRDGNGEITHSYGKFPMWHDEFKFWMKEKRTKTLSAKVKFPIEVDYVTGANLFMRKNVLEQYGAFDPDFFLYYEETEMLYRFSKKV